MKYEKMIQSILEEVGGQENIENVYHCATRLRFQLKDETKANDEAVKAIDGVLSIVKGGGQYQIVIGQHVADVYNELQTMMGTTENEIELKDAKEFKQEMKKKKISSQFIDVISGVFTPVLGMLTATGVIKGLLAFLAATGLLATTSGTYQMLNIVGDCFFNFLPIFLGYTSMKKFGGTPFIGMAIGAALVYPSLTTIMAGDALYTLFSGTIFQTDVYVEFLGIPVLLMNYASSVIPVILTCYFAAKIEKFFAKRISDLFKTFAVPALTLLISIILAFLIIGPIATFASDLLGAAFTALFNLNATISGFLYGALIQVCVMFGVHWGFVAISVNNLATLGYDPITIAGLVLETSLVSLCMKIMSVLITVILYGRMIEIYLYCSVSPIPFATMTNREWGQIGNNYLKGLFALGFQGFLIMICVGIYAVLVNDMIIADNLHSAVFSLAAYTVILCFSLFKSGTLAKSIFNAH